MDREFITIIFTLNSGLSVANKQYYGYFIRISEDIYKSV